MTLLVTCEHGGNRIPAPYEPLFSRHRALLDTHQGFDAGALTLAEATATALGAPLLAATVSRLLVDLNRSIGHPGLHFDTVRTTPAPTRHAIIEQHYRPYRARVEALVENAIARHGWVLHLSCHSFTPSLNGITRNADIGLLYDPKREAEKRFCQQWQRGLRMADHALTVRRNYPYRGNADGQTTTLRRRFDASRYLGIELEINQRHVLADGARWSALQAMIVHTLAAVLEHQTHNARLAAEASRQATGDAK